MYMASPGCGCGTRCNLRWESGKNLLEVASAFATISLAIETRGAKLNEGNTMDINGRKDVGMRSERTFRLRWVCPGISPLWCEVLSRLLSQARL